MSSSKIRLKHLDRRFTGGRDDSDFGEGSVQRGDSCSGTDKEPEDDVGFYVGGLVMGVRISHDHESLERSRDDLFP